MDEEERKSNVPMVITGDQVMDSELAIIGGSDTSSIALTTAVFLLAQHPEYQRKLQEEIDPLVKSSEESSHQSLVGKPMLEGVINETLRLWSPVSSAMQRITPAEGLEIGGTFIPGNTIVAAASWTIVRDSRAFVDPDDFIPERWSSKPELIKRKDAFFPFLHGVFACAGRPLALMELRLAIAMLIRKFSFAFADETSEEVFLSRPGPKDCMTLQLSALHLIFKER